MADQSSWAFDFFIAHAGPDTAEAEELHRLLAPSARVFLDSQTVLPGDDWDTELASGQKRSLVTVVLVSSRSGAAYYQREEIAAALAMAREDKQRHRVVPVYLQEVSGPEVPYGLRMKHALSLARHGGLSGVATHLLSLLGKIRPAKSTTDNAGGHEAVVSRSGQAAAECHSIVLNDDLVPSDGDRAIVLLIDELVDSIRRKAPFRIEVVLPTLRRTREELALLSSKRSVTLLEREQRASLRNLMSRFAAYDVPCDEFLPDVIETVARYGWQSYGISTVNELAECVTETLKLYSPAEWPTGVKFQVFPPDQRWYASFRVPRDEAAALADTFGVPMGYLIAGFGVRLLDFATSTIRARALPALAFEYFRIKYGVKENVPAPQEFFALSELQVGLG